MEKIKVLVTGSRGFIGSSFVDYFSNNDKFEILKYDRFTDKKILLNHLKECDYIFNFAGVIKSNREKDFYQSNVKFVNYLVKNCIKLKNNKFSFVYISSIWAENSPNSPYGKSKKQGEELIEKLSKKYNFKFYIYRLTNIFGEKSVPNYGGVISNFCYNAVHNIPFRIDDPKKEYNFIYINNLLNSFKDLMLNNKKIGIQELPSSDKISIGELADLISNFSKGIVPQSKFEKELFNVYKYHNDNFNDVQYLKDVSIVVSSCDKYSDAWMPMFKLFSKYGEALTKCQIVLNTESKDFSYSGLNILSTGRIKNTTGYPWAKRLKFALDQVKTKYVIFLMEDYFLKRPVNCNLISKCVQYMNDNKSIGCFNFEPLCKVNNEDDKYCEFCRVPIGTPYRFNAQTALWRLDVFKNSFLDNESPWDWEYFGNMRNDYSFKDKILYALSWETPEPFFIDFYSTCKDYSGNFVSKNGIMRGKWNVEHVDELFKNNDITINYDALGVFKTPKYKYKQITKFFAKLIYNLRHSKFIEKKYNKY